jgi:hypothetical protein
MTKWEWSFLLFFLFVPQIVGLGFLAFVIWLYAMLFVVAPYQAFKAWMIKRNRGKITKHKWKNEIY